MTDKSLFNFTAAVIGTGYIGIQHLEALKSVVSEVVVCNVDAESGKAAAEKYGYRFYSDYTEMFKKEMLDFVDICVPTHLHAKIALDALEAGINVLCEKPFTTTLDDAHKVTLTAKEKNLSLMVAHCVRFCREYSFLKKCIDEKRYGSLVSLELYRNGPKPAWSTNNWLFDMEKSGGVVRDAHIHDTDIINYILGCPKRVYTKGSAFCCSTLYDYGTELLVTASASWRSAAKYPFSPMYEAAFEKGVLCFTGKELLLYTDDKITQNVLESESFPYYLQSESLIFNEITYFCHCLENKIRTEMCETEQVCKSLEISFAESESMMNNKMVEISR